MVTYGGGCLTVATDGGIFDFSDQPFEGSLVGDPLPHPIVGVGPGVLDDPGPDRGYDPGLTLGDGRSKRSSGLLEAIIRRRFLSVPSRWGLESPAPALKAEVGSACL